VRFCESTFGLETVKPQTAAADMGDCFDLSTVNPLPPPSYAAVNGNRSPATLDV
jgi:hypothetical protein